MSILAGGEEAQEKEPKTGEKGYVQFLEFVTFICEGMKLILCVYILHTRRIKQ
jgi:hypothetical protein